MFVFLRVSWLTSLSMFIFLVAIFWGGFELQPAWVGSDLGSFGGRLMDLILEVVPFLNTFAIFLAPGSSGAGGLIL